MREQVQVAVVVRADDQQVGVVCFDELEQPGGDGPGGDLEDRRARPLGVSTAGETPRLLDRPFVERATASIVAADVRKPDARVAGHEFAGERCSVKSALAAVQRHEDRVEGCEHRPSVPSLARPRAASELSHGQRSKFLNVARRLIGVSSR
jgi:hypothetical protein